MYKLIVNGIIAFCNKIASLSEKDAKKFHTGWKKEALEFTSNLSIDDKAKLVHTLVLLLVNVAASDDPKQESAAVEVSRTMINALDEFFISIECKECPNLDTCDHVHDLKETMLRLVDRPRYDDWFENVEPNGDEIIERSQQKALMN